MKKIANIIIVILLLINIFVIYIYIDGKIKMFYSPFHNYPVSLDDIDNKDKFISSYFSKLKKYELFSNAYEIDSNMINISLRKIILNNKYIDLTKISDYIAITDVSISKNEGMVNGQTYGYKTFLFDDIYKIDVNIYKDSPSVYYHELLHSIFPWKDKKYNFFSESLISILVDESYKVDHNLYYNEKIITKMWIETLGVDVFKEMIATGTPDAFYEKLRELKFSDSQIDSIIENLYLLHQKTIEEGKIDNEYLDLCVNDISMAFLKINNFDISIDEQQSKYLEQIYYEEENYINVSSGIVSYFIN